MTASAAEPAGGGLADELLAAAITLVGGSGRVVLGIAGAPGAGKTTLAELLVREVGARQGADWVAHLPMDGFHLADRQLHRLHALGRKGSPDTFDAQGYAHLVERMTTEPDKWIYAPGFDRTLEQPLAADIVVPPSARLIITEGNYLLLEGGAWPRARAAMREVWFVSGNDEQRVDRLVRRHITFGKRPQAARAWVESSDQVNAELVSAGSTQADRVVLNGPHGWSFATSRPFSTSG